ncbi:MAG TPA: MBL fold metallo-hydrolase [Solirubrobacteraceae bacterium]|nr:MBL fold metallo-hydrolase [Solirubrobacteraceae bacterium]
MTCLRPADHDVIGIRAANPGPLTLSGTNSWIVGRDPAWLIDPGPLLEAHLAALQDALDARGGLGGVALTHDHVDHSAAVGEVRRRHPDVPLAAARGEVDVHLCDGDGFGPLRALSLPGHAPDHLVLLAGPVAFTGDAVLGEGSVFIAPDPGALSGYLAGLRRLREQRPAVLCPGHGPIVTDPQSKLDEYIGHRLDRERRLLAALAEGRRSVEELLDRAWADAPPELRAIAAITLAAHLDKLEDEGRLPAGVERPERWLGEA